MVWEQEQPPEQSEDRFGAIAIRPDGGSSVGHEPPREKKRVGKPPAPVYGKPVWFILPLILAGLFIVGFYVGIPALVKGLLAEKVGNRIGRSVTVGDVKLSPFPLKLHLGSITVARERNLQDAPDLLHIGTLQCELSLFALLRGRVACKELAVDQLEVSLVRGSDGRFNVAFQPLELLQQQNMPLWPSWLELQRVEITRSVLTIDDRLAGSMHRVEKIHFLLPYNNGQLSEVTPVFSAVVNESPVRISGIRQENAKGYTETRLHLEFNGISLAEHLSYLPQLSENVQNTSGNVDGVLELILTEQKDDAESTIIRGEIKIADLRLQKEEDVTLHVPAAQISMEVEPTRNRYRVQQVTLKNPELSVLRFSAEHVPLPKLLSLFTSRGLNLEVERLLVENGVVRFESENEKAGQDEVWHDVHLSLTGFHSRRKAVKNGTDNESASFVLNAVHGGGDEQASIAFQGYIHGAGRINGQVSLKNIDLHGVHQFMPLVNGARLAKGTMDFDGSFSWPLTADDKGRAVKLGEGRLLLWDFAATREERLLFSGKRMVCSSLELSTDSRRVSCGRVDISKGQFFPETWSIFSKPDSLEDGKSWKFEPGDLNIQDSTIQLPLSLRLEEKEAPALSLNAVSLQLSGLNRPTSQDNNVALTANIGESGQVRLNGQFRLHEKGELQLAFKDLDLTIVKPLFASWFVPKIQQGVLHGRGAVRLPEKKFRGTLWLENISAGVEGETFVSWQQAKAEDAELRLRPFSFFADTLLLKQPVVGLIESENVADQFFRVPSSLDPSFDPGTVAVNRIDIHDGTLHPGRSFLTPDYVPELQSVEGTVINFRTFEPFSFSFTGKMGTADFSTTGKAKLMGVEQYALNVNNFSLAQVSDFFAVAVGAETESARADWEVISTNNDVSTTLNGRIDFRHFFPMAGSDFMEPLALFTDENGKASVSLQSLPQNDTSSGHLFEEIVRNLQLNHVRSVVSQHLVLRDMFPLLELPEHILFLPGKPEAEIFELLGDYVPLLAQRPHLQLVLQGSFNRDEDHEMLRQVLQEEADAQRSAENLRREQRLLLQKAEMERSAGEAPGSGIDDLRGRMEQDLRPLPPVQVQVQDNMLKNLAAKRAEFVRRYLIDELAVPVDRIKVNDSFAEGRAGVGISFQADWQ